MGYRTQAALGAHPALKGELADKYTFYDVVVKDKIVVKTRLPGASILKPGNYLVTDP